MKKMMILLLLVFWGIESFAQGPTNHEGLGLGFHITQMPSDFGIGLNLTSPMFLNGAASLNWELDLWELPDGSENISGSMENQVFWEPFPIPIFHPKNSKEVSMGCLVLIFFSTLISISFWSWE